MILILILTAILLPSSDAVRMRLGACPPVEPQPSFDIDKFIGTWYVVQKYSTGSKCVTINVTREGRDYYVNEIIEPIGIEIMQKGKIYFDKNVKSKMEVDFPMTATPGKQNFWVMMTDYDNYAAVWTCVRILFGHREIAQIMSRTPKIDLEILKKIHEKFAFYGVDGHAFSFVDHENCDYKLQAEINNKSSNFDLNIGPIDIAL